MECAFSKQYMPKRMAMANYSKPGMPMPKQVNASNIIKL